MISIISFPTIIYSICILLDNPENTKILIFSNDIRTLINVFLIKIERNLNTRITRKQLNMITVDINETMQNISANTVSLFRVRSLRIHLCSISINA